HRPCDRGAQLPARGNALPPRPRARQIDVDPARPAGDEHDLEIGELGVLADVLHDELAGDLDLLRELARDRGPRREPELELWRLLEETEHHPSSKRGSPASRHRTISSRHCRKTSSLCIAGSSMSPAPPASSRSRITGFPCDSGNSLPSVRRCSSVIAR